MHCLGPRGRCGQSLDVGTGGYSRREGPPGLGGKGKLAEGVGLALPRCHVPVENTKESENSKLQDAFQVVRKVSFSRREDREYCSNG